jgi:hypothetical protein
MKIVDAKLGSNADQSKTPARQPNPKRVAAGKLNHAKRKGLTPEGRERLREAALLHQPWRFSTGPRSPAGKARIAARNKARQQGPLSVREIRADLASLRSLVGEMMQARKMAYV